MRKVVTVILSGLFLLLSPSCRQWSPEEGPGKTEYELKGNVTSMKNTVYGVDSTETGYAVSGIEASLDNIYVEFDTDGKVTVLQRFNAGNRPTGKELFHYGKGSRLESRQIVSAEGKTLETSVYRYRNGRLQSVTVMDGSGKTVKREEYHYYGKGRVRINLKGTDGSDKSYQILEYDKYGRNLSNVMYSSKGDKILSDFRYEYDSLGRVSAFFTESALLGVMNGVKTYDSNGFCCEQLLSGSKKDSRLTYRFKTDARGNWIERTTERDGTPIRLETREIEYGH